MKKRIFFTPATFAQERNLCLKYWPKWYVTQQEEMEYEIDFYFDFYLEGKDAFQISTFEVLEALVEENRAVRDFDELHFYQTKTKDHVPGSFNKLKNKQFVKCGQITEEKQNFWKRRGTVNKRRTRWNHEYRYRRPKKWSYKKAIIERTKNDWRKLLLEEPIEEYLPLGAYSTDYPPYEESWEEIFEERPELTSETEDEEFIRELFSNNQWVYPKRQTKQTIENEECDDDYEIVYEYGIRATTNIRKVA